MHNNQFNYSEPEHHLVNNLTGFQLNMLNQFRLQCYWHMQYYHQQLVIFVTRVNDTNQALFIAKTADLFETVKIWRVEPEYHVYHQLDYSFVSTKPQYVSTNLILESVISNCHRIN